MTSGGRNGCAWAPLFCVLTWSMEMLVSTSNVTCRLNEPSFALVDCTYSRLSAPDICCSIGVATDCSTDTASAPV